MLNIKEKQKALNNTPDYSTIVKMNLFKNIGKWVKRGILSAALLKILLSPVGCGISYNIEKNEPVPVAQAYFQEKENTKKEISLENKINAFEKQIIKGLEKEKKGLPSPWKSLNSSPWNYANFYENYKGVLEKMFGDKEEILLPEILKVPVVEEKTKNYTKRFYLFKARKLPVVSYKTTDSGDLAKDIENYVVLYLNGKFPHRWGFFEEKQSDEFDAKTEKIRNSIKNKQVYFFSEILSQISLISSIEFQVNNIDDGVMVSAQAVSKKGDDMHKISSFIKDIEIYGKDYSLLATTVLFKDKSYSVGLFDFNKETKKADCVRVIKVNSEGDIIFRKKTTINHTIITGSSPYEFGLDPESSELKIYSEGFKQLSYKLHDFLIGKELR